VFSAMVPLFEKVMNTSFEGKRIAAVVKSMTYLLDKPGDTYVGNSHREGMGEGIAAVGIYYPHVDDDAMSGGQLGLTMLSIRDRHKKLYFETQTGTLIVFSNECYHKLKQLKYDFWEKVSYWDRRKREQLKQSERFKNAKPIERSILAFFVMDCKHDRNREKMNELCNLGVNVGELWSVIVANW
jgi:hypothetical protein